MATNFDILLTVTNKYVSNHIGHNSKYSSSKENGVPHPGTGLKIEGWKWDGAIWPSYSELSDYSYIPTIFDSGDHLPEYLFQSGAGYEDDIKMEDCKLLKRGMHTSSSVIDPETGALKEYSSKDFWTPQILTGDYFIYNKRWYLFSDQHITEQLAVSLNNSPGEHPLLYVPKDDPVTPIFIRRFARDKETSRLYVIKELEQHFYNGVAPDYDTSDFDPATLSASEFYVDVDNGFPVKIFTSSSLANETKTENISVTPETSKVSLETFPVEFISITDQSGNVILSPLAAGWTIDKDLGEIKLPENHGATELTINYKETYSVIYEPSFASNTVSAYRANVNPLYNAINRGFVQITTEILDPYSIELTSDLPSETTALGASTYDLELGNNVGKLIAKVKNKVGTLLEGIRVYFEWGLPEDLSSITDSNGEAFMYYSSPNTLEEIGEYFPVPATPAISDLTINFTSEGIPEGTNVEEIWIFALDHLDEMSGLKDQAAVNEYYLGGNEISGYLSEEGLPADAEIEKSYRKYNFPDIDNPDVNPISIASLNDNTGDLTVGRRKMMLKQQTDSVYINPKTNTRADENNPVWWPIHPVAYAGGVLSYLIDDIPTGTNAESVNSYFIVSNQKRRIRAYAISGAGERVYSNYITVKIKIPDTFNGTFYKSVLQEPFLSGLLREYQELPMKAEPTDLDTYWHPEGSYPNDDGSNPTAPVFLTLPDPTSAGGKIPVGFRIKTQGVTVASFLDQVTFINPHGQDEEPGPTYP